jgi:hypothetical protein
MKVKAATTTDIVLISFILLAQKKSITLTNLYFKFDKGKCNTQY